MTDKIWEIMRENKFETDNENLEEIKCLICKSLMINASSGPCGCLYCLKCITEYLNRTDTVCPGNTNECQQRKLNLTEDILIDRSTNIKILKSIVKCPNKNCDFKDELRKIENHMQICNKRCLLCPISRVECKHNLIQNNIDEIVSHSKLLIDSNDNLKNEMEALKIHITDLTEQIDIIKTEKTANENKLNQTIIEMQTNNNQFNEEIKYVKNENKSLIKDIKIIKENYNKSQIIVKQLKEEIQNLNNKNSNQMKSIKGEIGNIRKHYQESSNCYLQENVFMKRSNRINNMMVYAPTSFLTPTKKTVPNVSSVDQNFAPYVWKIDNFLKKRDEAKSLLNTNVYSKPFYSFGYKMRLRANLSSHQNGESTYLSVYFSLLEGENDDTLLWPMERRISIALMDQRNNTIHTCKTYCVNTVAENFKEIFQKPALRKLGEDYYYGSETLININSIMNNAKLYKKRFYCYKMFC